MDRRPKGTGNRRSLFGRIARAASEADFRADLLKQRGDYYAHWVTIEPGVARNAVTTKLWREATLMRIERSGDAGHVFLEGELHLNFS